MAVITPDAPDVLSHVSVRARNMRVLFATCHDDGPLKQLREVCACAPVHSEPIPQGNSRACAAGDEEAAERLEGSARGTRSAERGEQT